MYVSELEAKVEAAERRAAELEAAAAEAAPAPATASAEGTLATTACAAWVPRCISAQRIALGLNVHQCCTADLL